MRSYFPRGFFPGWLSSANSPLVLEIMQMTSHQVGFPPPSPLIPKLTWIHLRIQQVIISVGSPALAAYSLVLTSLNARLVYRRATRIKHECKHAVARALISLQQTSLELTQDERLLAFLLLDDQWRREVVDRLRGRNAWSIATAASVAWVVIAFLFTLIDSFTSPDDYGYTASEGHAVGMLWLWLLCLVIGWLWVPSFSCRELNSALHNVNRKAAKKAAKGVRQQVSTAYGSAKAEVISRLPKQMPTLRAPRIPVVAPSPGANEECEKTKVEQTQEVTKPFGQELEVEPNLLPVSAHHPSTVSSKSPTASQHDHDHNHNHDHDHDHDHVSINISLTASHSAVSLPGSAAAHPIAAQSSVHPETDRLLIPNDDFNSLNRDEFRLAATFNYSRVMRYLVLVDDVFGALDKLTRKKDGVGLSRKRLASEVFSLILNRSGPTLMPLPSPPGVLFSHWGRSCRCSMHRFSPLFSSVELPPRP